MKSSSSCISETRMSRLNYLRVTRQQDKLQLKTKPAVALFACFVVPCALQTATRRLYSIMFYCILSRVITHFKLGPEITSRKSKAFKKGQHYDGGGGAPCMLCDKISDALRGAEKKSKK